MQIKYKCPKCDQTRTELIDNFRDAAKIIVRCFPDSGKSCEAMFVREVELTPTVKIYELFEKLPPHRKG